MKIAMMSVAAFAVIGLANAGEVKVSKSLNRDYWTGVKGVYVKDLTSSEKFKGKPNGSDEVKAGFKAVSWKDAKKDQKWGGAFGEKLYGYLVPKESGSYVFALSNDDAAELYISTDANPKNKKKVLNNRITPYGKWSKGSKPVKLEAGKPYYVELLHKENTGNTYVLVGWKKAGDKKYELVGAEYLSSFKGGVPGKK